MRQQGHLRKFLLPLSCFYYCTFSKVYDLRSLRLSWGDFGVATGAMMPSSHQGFPTIGGAPGLNKRVLDLCRKPGVIERPSACDSVTGPEASS